MNLDGSTLDEKVNEERKPMRAIRVSVLENSFMQRLLELMPTWNNKKCFALIIKMDIWILTND